MLSFFKRRSSQNADKLANHLTQFDGFIRRLDSSKLTAQQFAQFNALFPAFSDTYERDKDGNVQIQIDAETLQPLVRVSRPSPPRRFAGHLDRITFPRGRYFTVARDIHGNDGGTLLRELFAYSATDQQIKLADARHSVDLKFLREFNIEPAHPDSLLILQLFSSASPRVIMEIPLRTQHVTIPHCVDLRQLRTQEWFYNRFLNGTDEISFLHPTSQNIKEFTDMLPALMWPSLGGGGIDEYGSITRAIGYWFRTNNVSALIFPSARSNALVRYTSGKINDFYGWNLVDYRNTQDDANFAGVKSVTTILVSGWPSGFPYPSTLEIDGKGSWQINGPEEYLFRNTGGHRPITKS